MRRSPNRPAAPPDRGEDKPLCDYLPAEDSGESVLWENTEGESLAKKITDPLLEKLREEIRNIDVSRFKK